MSDIATWRKRYDAAMNFLDASQQADLSDRAWRYAVAHCIYVLTVTTKTLAENYVSEKRGIRVQSIGEMGKALTQYGLISAEDEGEWIGLVAIGDQIGSVKDAPDTAVIKALVSVRKYGVFRRVFAALEAAFKV